MLGVGRVVVELSAGGVRVLRCWRMVCRTRLSEASCIMEMKNGSN